MIYAIGDAHGEADALRELLNKLPVAPSDLVVFLGDAINRGPDSYECVEQILAFEKCRKVFVQGNHEETMFWFLEGSDTSGLLGMDGQVTLDSYSRAGYTPLPGVPESVPASHLSFYAQSLHWTLPFYITDDYVFTHAGWNLSLPIERQSAEAMRWGGIRGYDAPVWTQTVVRGHVPFPKVMFAHHKQYIGVDTGCGMGGYLSAVALHTKDTWTARPKSYRSNWFANRRG